LSVLGHAFGQIHDDFPTFFHFDAVFGNGSLHVVGAKGKGFRPQTALPVVVLVKSFGIGGAQVGRQTSLLFQFFTNAFFAMDTLKRPCPTFFAQANDVGAVCLVDLLNVLHGGTNVGFFNQKESQKNDRRNANRRQGKQRWTWATRFAHHPCNLDWLQYNHARVLL
jgi:hypothetical protein